MCNVDDDDVRCEVWNEKTVVARKEHKCSCCERVIKAGEKYMTHFSLFDGHSTSEKMCADCEADRQLFADHHEGTLYQPGDVTNRIQECIYHNEEEDEWHRDTGRPVEDRHPDWHAVLARIKARGAEQKGAE